jgi:hypothetical protein
MTRNSRNSFILVSLVVVGLCALVVPPTMFRPGVSTYTYTPADDDEDDDHEEEYDNDDDDDQEEEEESDIAGQTPAFGGHAYLAATPMDSSSTFLTDKAKTKTKTKKRAGNDLANPTNADGAVASEAVASTTIPPPPPTTTTTTTTTASGVTKSVPVFPSASQLADQMAPIHPEQATSIFASAASSMFGKSATTDNITPSNSASPTSKQHVSVCHHRAVCSGLLFVAIAT